MQLDHSFETVAGLRYKVDSNHDIVYLEFDEPPSMTTGAIREAFYEDRPAGALRRRGVGRDAAEDQDATAAGLKKRMEDKGQKRK